MIRAALLAFTLTALLLLGFNAQAAPVGFTGVGYPQDGIYGSTKWDKSLRVNCSAFLTPGCTAYHAEWTLPVISYSNDTSPNTTFDWLYEWPGIADAVPAVASACLANNCLLQLGFAQKVSGTAGPYCMAWYEALGIINVTPIDPANTVGNVWPGTTYPCAGGDNVTADLTCSSCNGSTVSGSTQTIVLTLSDSTQSWTWTQTFSWPIAMKTGGFIFEVPNGLGTPAFAPILVRNIQVNGSPVPTNVGQGGAFIQNGSGGNLRYMQVSGAVGGAADGTGNGFYICGPAVSSTAIPLCGGGGAYLGAVTGIGP